MGSDGVNTRARSVPDRQAAGGLLERLQRFEGPPEEFLPLLLAFQCGEAGAPSGVVLRLGAPGQAEVLAVHPAPVKGGPPPAWLSEAAAVARTAIESGGAAARPLHDAEDLYGQPARRHLVGLPLPQGLLGAVAEAFLLDAASPAQLAACCDRLKVTLSLCSLYESHLALARRQGNLDRLRRAMETLAAVNEQPRFAGAAMAFCNEVAARWQADRASLGLLKGRYVRLRAMSHTENFGGKMKLIQDIEAAMEECLDQDLEVLCPAEGDATCVCRAAAELSNRHGPLAVVSLPVRHQGEAAAVLTVERAAGMPFSAEEIEALRLTCDLCGTRLLEREAADRWVGARMAEDLRKGLAALVGPRHTWLKLAAAGVLGVILFLAFAKGPYKVEAPFVLEASERQIVAAPFDEVLEAVFVEPGDDVEGGKTELGTLRTANLRVQLAGLKAEQFGRRKEAQAAQDKGQTAEAQIAEAKADKVGADIRLLEDRVTRARLLSPISGKVISEDLKRLKDKPVQTGDVLFEIAPVESLRAELYVPEDLISDVQVGLEGELAVVGHPGTHILFTVARINPVAEVVKQRNVFRVRVRLKETHEWMRPGMEGVAKVSVDRRLLARIWTRRLVNWVRMTLWL